MIGYEIIGVKNARKFFQKMMKKTLDLRPAFNEIEQKIYLQESALFEGGGRWKALSKSYAKWKAEHYPGRPKMVLTGALKRSLTKKGSNGQVRIIESREMEIGTSIPYARAHQDGGKLPQRKIIQPKRKDIISWVTSIVRYLSGVSGNRG